VRAMFDRTFGQLMTYSFYIMLSALPLSGGCARPAMSKIQVGQTNGSDEDREAPAERHRHPLDDEHHDCIHKEHISANDEVDDAFVDKP